MVVSPTTSPSVLHVSGLTAAEHSAKVAELGASFLQVPQWARVKPGWRSESLGWHTPDGTLVGVGLVLYRMIPKLGRSLAYLPEGPALPWQQVAQNPAGWLDPLVAHVRAQRAFTLRIGPPVVHREWLAANAKAGLADDSLRDFAQLTPDVTHPEAAELAHWLRGHGWQRVGGAEGFAAGQPAFVVQIPLTDRTPDQLKSGMNQLWRRNIAKAAKLGVQVRQGTSADLATFHTLYRETAQRDGFIPRPESYFTGMWQAFEADSSDSPLRLYLAELDGQTLAAATVITIGTHVWYGYGASTSERRDARASNALQWHAICAAAEGGATVYDLRGISSTLAADSPLAGLLQFKLGTGGTTIEYLGEWDLPLSPLLHKAFQLYLKRRG